jgi:hypothetical protein
LEILKEIHDSPIDGHAGINQIYRKLKQYINWQGMKSDLEKYIKKCEKCQKNKITQCHTRMPLMITDALAIILEMCSIDLGPLCPSSSQHHYILTVKDDLLKFLRAVLLEDQTAEQVAKAFVDHIVLICAIPQVILSNCGSQFLSETCKSVCKLLVMKCIQSTSFWPQSNGLNKHSYKGLIEYLTNCFAANLSNCDQWVKYAVFVHNKTPHSATSHIPFQLLFGQLPNLPGVLQRQHPVAVYAYDMYIKELEAVLQSSYAMAHKNLETSIVDNKCHYDCCIHVPKFEIGSRFW